MSNCKCEMCSDCFDGLKAQLAAEKARADAAEAALEDQRRALGVVQRSHLDDAIARADDLSRMVAAMGEVSDKLRHEVDMLTDGHDNPKRNVTYWDGRPIGEAEWKKPLRAAADAARAILSRPDVAAERGRWVLRRDFDDLAAAGYAANQRTLDAVEARDAAIAAKEKAEAERDGLRIQSVVRDTRFSHAVAARDEAERSRDELGIQLAACQERLRLAMAVVKASRNIRHWHDTLRGEGMVVSSEAVRTLWLALAALDAVPGDALATSTKKDGE